MVLSIKGNNEKHFRLLELFRQNLIFCQASVLEKKFIDLDNASFALTFKYAKAKRQKKTDYSYVIGKYYLDFKAIIDSENGTALTIGNDANIWVLHYVDGKYTPI